MGLRKVKQCVCVSAVSFSSDSHKHFVSQLGVIIPEKVLGPNSSVALVKVASRYIALVIAEHKWLLLAHYLASLVLLVQTHWTPFVASHKQFCGFLTRCEPEAH